MENRLEVVAGNRFPSLLTSANRLRRAVQGDLPHSTTQYSRQFSGFGEFLRLKSLFLAWLGEWFQARRQSGAEVSVQRANDDRILLAVRLLNEAPVDQGFPKAQIEKTTGLGEAHLNRLFIRSLNLTTRSYWNLRRLDFAKNCLGTSRVPIKEVSYRLGFRSDSHFVVWFHRLTGARPTAFRENFNLIP